MRELVETTATLVHAVRLADPAQWLVRLLALGGLLGSGLLCAAWVGGPLATPLLLVIAALGLWAMARPGSPAPLLAVGVVVVWWLFGGEPQWWQGACLAGLLAVAHLACAQAAAAPSYAAVRPRALRRLLGWGLGYLSACALGVALVLAVAAIPAEVMARGQVWVGLGLLGLVGTAVVVHGLRHRA
ncbi:hypothetical protein GCM10028820_08450 [Tessaracoccus terricola]